MLQIRLEGDLAEANAFLEALATGGAEVQKGTAKNRGEFHHVYAVVRMPGWSNTATREPVVHAQSTIERPALPASRRRTSATGRRLPR